MTEPPLMVGVCTCQRDGINSTLTSIFTQTKQPSRIIVVDNDDTPSARPAVEALAAQTDIPIEYAHVPGRSIAIARNGVLARVDDCLLAFIDDDEIAAPDWLEKLFAVWASAPGCAAVFGPQLATYDADAPKWMTELSPHSYRGYDIDGEVQAGSTGNCLIDLRHPTIAERRFNETLQPYEGSDTQFFLEAFRAGARYRFTPAAQVTTPVPDGRATWGWLVRRKYRQGMIFVRSTDRYSPRTAAIAALKFAVFCGASLITLPWAKKWRKSALRGAMQAGIAVAAMGWGPSPVQPEKPNR